MNINKTINILLIILAIGIFITAYHPQDLITGKVLFYPSETGCVFHNQESQSKIPTERCCYELEKQLECKIISPTQIKCYISEDSQHYYITNKKTINNCKEKGYHIQ